MPRRNVLGKFAFEIGGEEEAIHSILTMRSGIMAVP